MNTLENNKKEIFDRITEDEQKIVEIIKDLENKTANLRNQMVEKEIMLDSLEKENSNNE